MLQFTHHLLNGDMDSLVKFFRKRRLQSGLGKTFSSVFHLRNAKSHQNLNVSLGCQKIRHDPNSLCSEITLDRSLTFHEHLRKTAAKVGTRNNLLSKLAGSSWGASAPTLRTSALAVCSSFRSQNMTQRTIFVKLAYLPILSHIPPLNLLRQEATVMLLTTVQMNDKVPLSSDINSHPLARLLSRHRSILPAFADICLSADKKLFSVVKRQRKRVT